MMAKLITLSVQLIIPNYLVILSHQHSTTVSSETYSFIHLILYFIYYYYYLKNNLTFLQSVIRPMMWLVMRPIMQPMIHHMFQSLIQFMIWYSLIRYDPGFVNTAVVSTSLSTLSHNYFCMYMYLVIAIRFRCWSFDLTVVHIHTCSRLCFTGAWLPKELSFSFRELKNIAILLSRVAGCALFTLFSSWMYDYAYWLKL